MIEKRNFTKGYELLMIKDKRTFTRLLLQELGLKDNKSNFYRYKNGKNNKGGDFYLNEWQWEKVEKIFAIYKIMPKDIWLNIRKQEKIIKQIK